MLLAAMFVAPGFAAYLFYQHPTWLGSSKINKGTLLTLPLALNAFEGNSKWRIVFLSSELCKKDCLEQLNLLARVRLALGRKLYQVDEWLILGDKMSSAAKELAPLLKEQDVHVTTLSSDQMLQLTTLSSNDKVFIVNPDNYFILSYPSGGNPEDIYKDLKLLLSTSENKSG